MINEINALTDDKKKQLKQGTKVEFKWYGSGILYRGYIEVDRFGKLYFCAEHNYTNGVLTDFGMQYYNSLESFGFFTYFEIIEQQTLYKLMSNIDLDKMHELESKIQSNISKEINDQFEKTVRENSCPPIKGEITKGKLKWRGVKLCQKRTTLDRMEQWIEQKGVIIGKPVVIDFSILYPKK